jgi:hypothetical protein
VTGLRSLAHGLIHAVGCKADEWTILRSQQGAAVPTPAVCGELRRGRRPLGFTGRALRRRILSCGSVCDSGCGSDCGGTLFGAVAIEK